MPRGTHPNSLANLKRGKATQFGADGDSRAKAAQAKGKLVQAERKRIADEMLALLDAPGKDGVSKRQELADQLMQNMGKSPEWYKLGLRMIGELPPEHTEAAAMNGPPQDDPLTKSLREEAERLNNGALE